MCIVRALHSRLPLCVLLLLLLFSRQLFYRALCFLLRPDGGMKERLLFHLRLGDSSSPPLATRKSLIGVESASIWSASGLLQPDGVDEEPPLVCTCVHSSSSSAAAVGFERGVVHVYHRQEDLPAYGRRRGSEEEKWRRLVLYPTRALGSASPIVSPSAAVPPDITCVALSPGGAKLAVGTSDGFVFVTQVSRGLVGLSVSAAQHRCGLFQTVKHW